MTDESITLLNKYYIFTKGSEVKVKNPFSKSSADNAKDEINADINVDEEAVADTSEDADSSEISEEKPKSKKRSLSGKKKKEKSTETDNASGNDDEHSENDAEAGEGNAMSADELADVLGVDKKQGFLAKLGIGGKKNKSSKILNYADYPHLQVLRPQEAYIFKGDYFQMDENHFSCILTLIHSDAAVDRFGAFWGLNLLPRNLPNTSKVIRFEQVHRLTDDWVASHQTRAESVAEANVSAQGQGGTNTTKRKASKASEDLMIVAAELADGATYLHVHFRLQVLSPSLEELDACTEMIRKGYIDAFSSITSEPYHGEQKNELANLFRKNENKMGHGFYFTSTEYAGSYSLVTHGIEDPNGEFVGFMKGDVNSSAVLFDVNGFDRNIVVADEVLINDYGSLIRRSNIWGSKIGQSCLLNNHRVAHFLITPVALDEISPAFKNFTNVVRMSEGDLNMFELFGERKQQLTLFPKQLEKLRVMTELIAEPNDNDRAVIRGSLEEVITQFYTDARMWVSDAQHHQDRLRVVGIPHEEVPKLDFFVTQLDQKHKALMAGSNDDELIHAYGILKMLFRSMLTNNGDLFNTTTSRVFDTANKARRVVYDFSDLLLRGNAIAMAQMINVISYALSGLGRGDVAIFHGADNITDPNVQNYLKREFEFLYQRGGRVCLLYDSITKYMENLSFNEGIKADYSITSVMVPADADMYEQTFGVALPGPLRSLLTQTHGTHNYLHRGMDNIIFQPELELGVKPTQRGA